MPSFEDSKSVSTTLAQPLEGYRKASQQDLWVPVAAASSRHLSIRFRYTEVRAVNPGTIQFAFVVDAAPRERKTRIERLNDQLSGALYTEVSTATGSDT